MKNNELEPNKILTNKHLTKNKEKYSNIKNKNLKNTTVFSVISRRSRWFILSILFLINITINMNHGTIPAATSEIKKTLDRGYDILGLFCSLVFLGNILDKKYLLFFSLIFNGGLLFVFGYNKNYKILILDRIFIGIFQSFISIYLPIWCELSGIKKRRNLMISIIQVGSPIGVILGYLLTWNFSFYIQAIILGVLAVIILFIPSMYFSSILNEEKLKKNNESENNLNDEKTEDNLSLKSEISKNFSQKNSFSESSFFLNYKFSSLNYIYIILTQKIFIICILALSNLYFIITAILYWASSYEKEVLKISDENNITLSFIIVFISSPTLGVIFGCIFSAKLCGYGSKHSIILCFIFSLFAGISSISFPLTDDILSFILTMWLVLFFCGAILANLIGFIISNIPKNLKGSANLPINLLSNFFGYLPAPLVYGIIYEKTKDSDSRLGIKIIIHSSFLCCFFIFIAMCIHYFTETIDNELLLKKSTKSVKSTILNITYNLAKIFNPSCNMVFYNNDDFLEEDLNVSNLSDEKIKKSKRGIKYSLSKENDENRKNYLLNKSVRTSRIFRGEDINIEDVCKFEENSEIHIKNKESNNNNNILDSSENVIDDKNEIINSNYYKEDLNRSINKFKNEKGNFNDINHKKDNFNNNNNFANLSIKTPNFDFVNSQDFFSLEDKEKMLISAKEKNKINLNENEIITNNLDRNSELIIPQNNFENNNIQEIKKSSQKNFDSERKNNHIKEKLTLTSYDKRQSDITLFGARNSYNLSAKSLKNPEDNEDRNYYSNEKKRIVSKESEDKPQLIIIEEQKEFDSIKNQFFLNNEIKEEVNSYSKFNDYV